MSIQEMSLSGNPGRSSGKKEVSNGNTASGSPARWHPHGLTEEDCHVVPSKFTNSLINSIDLDPRGVVQQLRLMLIA